MNKIFYNTGDRVLIKNKYTGIIKCFIPAKLSFLIEIDGTKEVKIIHKQKISGYSFIIKNKIPDVKAEPIKNFYPVRKYKSLFHNY